MGANCVKYQVRLTLKTHTMWHLQPSPCNYNYMPYSPLTSTILPRQLITCSVEIRVPGKCA